LFAAAYGTQFKIGYSEAMIGNVGLPNEYRKRPLPKGTDYGKMAWSEFFVNPIGGTLWVTTEDLLDRWVIKMPSWSNIERFGRYHSSYYLRGAFN
jgi:hypothetical protein